jgi:hypothetical protein
MGVEDGRSTGKNLYAEIMGRVLKGQPELFS